MAEIIRNEPLGGELWRMEFSAPELVREARPGQFVQIRVSPRHDPLLRRPISIFDADEATGVMRLLYKTVGRGTQLMTTFTAGQRLDVMGPLGNGFDLDTGCCAAPPVRIEDGPPAGKFACRAALVGGGVGCAPLLYLARALTAQGCGVDFYGGAANAAGLSFAACFELPGVTAHLATDDGSAGYHGYIAALFAARVTAANTDCVYCCGPTPMMEAVAAHCRRQGIAAQFSLEQHMACGVGACLGCACRLKPEDAGYAKVCKDGPVFALEQLALGREGGAGQ